jgi:hypothetical protein
LTYCSLLDSLNNLGKKPWERHFLIGEISLGEYTLLVLRVLVQSLFVVALLIVSSAAFAQAARPQFTLYADWYPTITLVPGKLEHSEKYMKVAKRFLDMNGISYTNRYLPWTRIMKIASEGQNILVNEVIRTRDREDRFIWLKKLHDTNYFVIGAATISVEDFSRKSILENNLITMCEYYTAQCDLLNDIGFPYDQIIRIDNAVFQKQLELFNRGRIDVFVVLPEDYRNALGSSDWLDGPEKQVLKEDNFIEVYLTAAKKSLDPEALKALQQITSANK